MAKNDLSSFNRQPKNCNTPTNQGNLGEKKCEELFHVVYVDWHNDFHTATMFSADKESARKEFLTSKFGSQADRNNIVVLSAQEFDALYPDGSEYFLVFHKHGHYKILARTSEEAKTIFTKLFPDIVITNLAKQVRFTSSENAEKAA